MGWVSLSHTNRVCRDPQALVAGANWLLVVQTQAGGLFFSGDIVQSHWAYWVTHKPPSSCKRVTCLCICDGWRDEVKCLPAGASSSSLSVVSGHSLQDKRLLSLCKWEFVTSRGDPAGPHPCQPWLRPLHPLNTDKRWEHPVLSLERTVGGDSHSSRTPPSPWAGTRH